MSRLNGIQAKINRAVEHIDDLEREVVQAAQSNPAGQTLVAEADPQTGDTIYRVKYPHPIPTDRLAILAGDAVHNLRSALDHLAWQLVLANNCQPTRGPGGTAFPICKAAEAFSKTVAAGKINAVSQNAKAVIESVQPYQSAWTDLWLLSELDNIDKHCLLLVVGCQVASEGFRFDNLPAVIARQQTGENVVFPVFDMITDGSTRRVLQDGDIFCRRLAGADDHVDMHPQFTPTVAFREPREVFGQPVYDTLVRLRTVVESAVNLFVANNCL